jgi:putative addiction module component (TIGR02574 family)
MDIQVQIKKPNGAADVQLLDTEIRGAIVPTMPVTPEELAEQAMGLSADARAELADLLVGSLDAADLSSLDRAWAVEAKRRDVEVRAGKVSAIPAEEAFNQVRNSLER